jgi:hypothetical protein
MSAVNRDNPPTSIAYKVPPKTLEVAQPLSAVRLAVCP